MPTIEQLLEEPAGYHQQKVEVTGYLYLGREHVAIYPSADDRRVLSRGIWLVNPEAAAHGRTKLKALSGNMIRVTGTFISKSKRGAGHFNNWRAEIRGISRIEAVAP